MNAHYESMEVCVFRLSIENVFSVGTTESGMPYMIALAFYALFMFLTGKYLDRFDPKMIVLIGGLIVSIGWILSSFVSNIFLLMVTYGCISGAGVGIAYGVTTSGVLLDIHGNYYLLFVYVIALCVLGSIITMKYLKETL